MQLKVVNSKRTAAFERPMLLFMPVYILKSPSLVSQALKLRVLVPILVIEGLERALYQLFTQDFSSVSSPFFHIL